MSEDTARPPNKRVTIRSAATHNAVHPVVMLYRRQIDWAFHDAQLRRNGELTPLAQEALDWISARTDWTRIPIEKRMKAWGAPAPPPEIRSELYDSFDFACSVIGEDPDVVRTNGLSVAKPWLRGHRNGRPMRPRILPCCP